MDFLSYQKKAYEFKKYSDSIYPVIALGEETGEVQGLVAKAIRKHSSMYRLDRDSLKSELGDVLWNLAAVCSEFGMSLNDIAEDNIAKLDHRQDTGQIVERSVDGVS